MVALRLGHRGVAETEALELVLEVLLEELEVELEVELVLLELLTELELAVADVPNT